MVSRAVTGLLIVCAAFGLVSCGSEEQAPVEEETVTRTVTVREEAQPDTTREAPSDCAGSPEEVLARQYRLINEGEYGAAYGLFADESKALVTLEEYRSFFEANAPYSITDYSFSPVDVRGEDATVGVSSTLNDDEGSQEVSVEQELVCEGGAWRVVMRDDQVSAFLGAPQGEAAQYGDPEPGQENEPAPAPESGAVFVRITGDPGINFQGSIATLDQQRSVEGTTPQDFPVEVEEGFLEFDLVSANAQNMGGSGTLTVQIMRGDEVLKESTTTAQYGMAQVTWTPGE